MKRELKITFVSAALLAMFVFATCNKEVRGQPTASPPTSPPTGSIRDESLLEEQTNTIENIIIPLDLAKNYFDKLKEICDNDNGNLWKKNLYSPLLIIDPETLVVVANEPDNEGILVKQGNVYVGKFSENAIVANSTTEFGGRDWSMVAWPLPDDETERNMLLSHEMFHYQQSLLNMVSETDMGYDNSHMDMLDARVSIQLEWNSLVKALKSEEPQREEAIRDALIIRSDRRNQFSSGDNENKFEISEGLADYTMYKLCYSSNERLLNAVENRAAAIISQPSFVRNFGYLSGTLYGLLLDAAQPNWRENISYNTDLGELLKNACDIQETDNLTEAIKNKYNYVQIHDKEVMIKAEKDKIIADYKSKFTDNLTLTIALDHLSYGFNPNTVQPVPELGTIYPTIEITDTWGNLTVNEGGCLITEDFRKAVVTAEDINIKENMITGKGWILDLNEGYSIKGDGEYYIVAKE